MRNLIPIFAGVLMSITGLARADEPVLRYWKEIPPASKPEESLVAIPFDAEVYAATRVDLNDVRLRKADGTALPFLIRKAQEVRNQTIHRTTWPAAAPTLRPLDNGGLEITLQLADDDPQPNGLRLVTPLNNFEQRVRILTSASGQQWEPAGGETVIFDYSRYMDVRNENIPFPATSHRHVRVVIDDVTLEQQSELLELTRRLRGNDESDRTEKVSIHRRPFRIERIDFWKEFAQDKVHGDRKQSYPVVDFSVAEDPKTRQTIITIDTHREPLTSLELQTSSRNFSRNSVVEVLDQNGTHSIWRHLASTTLSQLDFKTLNREQLTIAFPESRSEKFRLVIDNRDSPPLTVTGVKAEGNAYEAIFLSAGNAPHQLAYGDPDAVAPSYDTAAIQTLLTERFHPESLTPGAEQKFTGTKPVGRFRWSQIVNDVRLLTGVIFLLVVVLGWGLYRAAKQIDVSTPPESPPPS